MYIYLNNVYNSIKILTYFKEQYYGKVLKEQIMQEDVSCINQV